MRILLDDKSELNVFYSGHSLDRESLFQQVDIPLTRGLLGYRVLVINQDDASQFKEINNLADFTRLISLGSGTSWPDTVILRAAGFRVDTGTIENLWPMLSRKRFTALPRGMSEIAAEMKSYPPLFPGATLVTEQSVMIGYKYDHFFYVAPENESHAAIIEQGLKRLYETGEFLRLFHTDPIIEAALADQQKHQRKVFMIPNPLTSERVEQIPAKYWHRFDTKADHQDPTGQ
jgi:hypothetical protein